MASIRHDHSRHAARRTSIVRCESDFPVDIGDSEERRERGGAIQLEDGGKLQGAQSA